MKLINASLLILTLAAPALTQSCSQMSPDVTSPAGNIQLSFSVHDGRPFYMVRSDGEVVIDTSYVGISMKNGQIGRNTEIVGYNTSSADTVWETVWGEEQFIRDHYNQLRVNLREKGDNGPIEYAMVFRVYDDGLGFRYEIPAQAGLDSITILDELTEFNIASNPETWGIDWKNAYYEALYHPRNLAELDTASTPVTMKVSDSLYIALHEAALTDYASLNVHPTTPGSTRLKAFLTPWSTGEKVFASVPLNTPWRTLTITKTPAQLMLSRIMLNLNEPCALEDVSWIEPGRYIGIWWGMHLRDYTWLAGPKHGATTENTRRYIDFAADHGYQGVRVEGWNKGWEGYNRGVGDEFSFTEPYPDYDLEGLAEYARSKGVRLIAHHETCADAAHYEAQMDSAFALCERLGINAAKTGYVGQLIDRRERHGSQYGVRHYRKVIEHAAKHHVMIDNHEPVMPTGLQRTYPNLMTQEGVRGQEWDAWSADGGNPPEHTVTIPFTRGLAGPMDFTPGTFNYTNHANPATRPRTTIAKQLALALVLYSPLQMSSDKIENYEGHPGLEFISSCPTTWAETIIPEAEIGRYVTMARKDRNSDDWYLASITGKDGHELSLPLDFLEAGAKYKARVFADGKDAHYDTNPYPLDVYDLDVDNRSVLNLQLAPGGGAAVIIKKL